MWIVDLNYPPGLKLGTMSKEGQSGAGQSKGERRRTDNSGLVAALSLAGQTPTASNSGSCKRPWTSASSTGLSPPTSRVRGDEADSRYCQ